MATLLTDSLERCAKLANGQSSTAFTMLELGTSDTAESAAQHGCQTPITDDGLEAKAGTASYEASGSKSVMTATWTATDTKAIAEVAWVSSDGKGFVRHTYGASPKNVIAGDEITFVVKVGFADGS